MNKKEFTLQEINSNPGISTKARMNAIKNAVDYMFWNDVEVRCSDIFYLEKLAYKEDLRFYDDGTLIVSNFSEVCHDEPEGPWTCPRCGDINPAGQLFCSTCGTPHRLEPINTEEPWCCPTCGTINHAGQLFCSTCGTQHRSEPINNPYAASFAPKDKEPAIDDCTCTGCSHFANCECDANGIIADLEKKIAELERVIEMKDTIISNLYTDITDLDEKAHRLTQTVDMLKAHADVYNGIINTSRKYNIPVCY